MTQERVSKLESLLTRVLARREQPRVLAAVAQQAAPEPAPSVVEAVDESAWDAPAAEQTMTPSQAEELSAEIATTPPPPPPAEAPRVEPEVSAATVEAEAVVGADALPEPEESPASAPRELVVDAESPAPPPAIEEDATEDTQDSAAVEPESGAVIVQETLVEAAEEAGEPAPATVFDAPSSPSATPVPPSDDEVDQPALRESGAFATEAAQPRVSGTTLTAQALEERDEAPVSSARTVDPSVEADVDPHSAPPASTRQPTPSVPPASSPAQSGPQVTAAQLDGALEVAEFVAAEVKTPRSFGELLDLTLGW